MTWFSTCVMVNEIHQGDVNPESASRMQNGSDSTPRVGVLVTRIKLGMATDALQSLFGVGGWSFSSRVITGTQETGVCVLYQSVLSR